MYANPTRHKANYVFTASNGMTTARTSYMLISHYVYSTTPKVEESMHTMQLDGHGSYVVKLASMCKF